MYSLILATQDDYNFLYNMLKITMKKYYIKTYGKWDDGIEKQYFKKDFFELQYQIILYNNHKIGCLAITNNKENIFINEIQILPEYQNKGIGGSLLKDIIEKADSLKLSIRLEVLKTNIKAKKFYEKHGFIVFEETETHYKMMKTKK